MNDIEMAIETLKDMKGVFDTRSHKQYSLPALDLAISALEKQIYKPIKVTKPSSSMTYVTCLSCGKFLDNRAKDDYCYGCGQKLDWRVEE